MNISNGFLIFYDWLPALENLSYKDFKTFLMALMYYQKDGTPLPEFPKPIKTIATFIVPQIDRRIFCSDIGKLGAKAKRAADKNPPSDIGSATSSAASSAGNIAVNTADGTPNGTAQAPPQALDKDKERDIDKDQDLDETESERNAADGDAVALAENARGISAGGRGYGRHGNVYLSTEEYLALSREIPMLPQYIDRFSEKMHQKGYRYPSHFDAIRQWWRRDKNLDAFAPEKEGSFETDRFFEAAVRRSLGDAFFERLND